jgi:alginate biosynthesis protein Alg44
LQDIIEAYLQGDIIPLLDEFINSIKREDLREALEARKPKAPQRSLAEETLRRIFILTLFITIISVLVLFILEALYTRVFLVKAVSAFCDAPLEAIRTPESGFFKFKENLKEGDTVKSGQILGFVNAPGIVSFIVPITVDGTITKIFVRNNEAVREGDPLVLIFPRGKKVYVLANILHKDLERVRIGDSVKILRFDGKIVKGYVKEIISPLSLASLHSVSPLPAYSLAWNYDRVIIEVPQNSFSIDDIGKSVEVEIDLTPPLLKPVFSILPRF